MMDLSDGLASDLKHILDRSGVGAEVAVEQIPAAPGADVRMAACSGEDYKLLLTAASASARRSIPSAASLPDRASCGSATENPSRWTGTASSTINANGGGCKPPPFAGRLLKYVPFALHESTRKEAL